MKIHVKLFIILLLLLGGCYPSDGTNPSNLPDTFITRYIDEDAGVVCWYSSQAIDCLPIDETDLGR